MPALGDLVIAIRRHHNLNWRECKGVEPSAHAEGRTPAELKSVRPTGTHPLPHCFVLPWIWGAEALVHGIGTQQDYREFGGLAACSGSQNRMIVEFIGTADVESCSLKS